MTLETNIERQNRPWVETESPEGTAQPSAREAAREASAQGARRLPQGRPTLQTMLLVAALATVAALVVATVLGGRARRADPTVMERVASAGESLVEALG